MSFSRHRLREGAFQTLFALASTPEADKGELYQAVLNLKDGEAAPEFMVELVDGVLDHEAELDQQIEQHLAPGWTLARLARPNLIILRLACFELTYQPGVPQAVVINEALQLAKTFSDDKSRKFINGVLGSMADKQK